MPEHNEERVTYRVVPTAAPVDPVELDALQAAVEVVVLWGASSVLHVEHLSPPRAFSVGEASDAKGRSMTDFVIGADALGVDRLPVVVAAGGRAGHAAESAILVPSGSDAEVVLGDERIDFATLVARGEAHASDAMRGAHEYALPAGATARIAYRGFTFVVTATTAARRVGTEGRARFDVKSGAWALASFAAHVAMLALFYATPPRASALSLDRSDMDLRMTRYLIEAPETEEEPPLTPEDHGVVGDEGAEGKAHDGEAGSMGKKDAPKTHKRFGIAGPKDNPDPHMAKEEAREMARDGGLIGILRSQVGAWDSPTSPYGREIALGSDPMSALGRLMGGEIGESGGHGALDIRGVGRGGGGDGRGTIGIGQLTTIGHDGQGITGSGPGSFGGQWRPPTTKVPEKIRLGKADVRGGLAKEVIQREIRRHLNEVRFCYEQALVAQPDLQGRVSVQFIIAPTGAVQTSVVAQSDLGHETTERCIASAVKRWTFPSPEGGGVVVVTYPFVLAHVGG